MSLAGDQGAALLRAAETGDSEAVRVLLDSSANIEAKKANGAAEQGHAKAVKLLLDRGVAPVFTPLE